jgi:hypothetical protein
MPCNGIAVMTAQTLADLQAHFQDTHNRAQFAEWLRERGVDVKRWWPSKGSWAIGIGSDWVGLKFAGSAIELSNERASDFKAHQAELDRAYALAQVYAGLVAQQQIVASLVALGLTPQNMSQDGGGTLTFNIQLVVPIKVRIYPTGSLDLVTEDGDFETGKGILETLLTTLQAGGVTITQTSPVETHRHDLNMVYTGEHTATVYVGQDITESGAPHTH